MINKQELNHQIDLLMEHGIEILNAIAGIAKVLSEPQEDPQPKTEPKKKKAKQAPPDPTPASVSPEEKPEPTPAADPSTPPSPTYTKEDVRKLLAEKAAADDGKYRSDVKFLVKKFGKGGALKDVAPEDYAALVAEAEALGNG